MRWICFLIVLGVLAGCADETCEEGCRPDEVYTVPLGAEDGTFYVGPYLMHTTQTSVAVSWETEAEGSTLVEVGRDEGYGRQIQGEAGSMHQVVVDGLEPQTVYHYRCCSGDVCTGDLTFATAPREGYPFRFAVLGDTRTTPANHKTVIDSVIRSEPTLVVNVGDVIEGRDEGDMRDEYKEMHFDPARQLGHYVPIYVAIGNHEYKEQEVVSFIDYMMFPEDPGVPFQEVSYTFTYGDVFFLILDSTLDHFDLFFPIGETEPPLWLWLNEVVVSEAAQNARWRFAFFHYAPDSPCYDDYGIPMTPLRNYVIPLLHENGFQAAFAGHVHDYERQDWEGFTVMITGGGGAPLETQHDCLRDVPELQNFDVLLHHLTVDVGCEQTVIRALDTGDQVFDEIIIDR
jgi:hypothetical protein